LKELNSKKVRKDKVEKDIFEEEGKKQGYV